MSAHPTVWVTSYAYDAADRLQSAGTTTFNWDANGNMTSRFTPQGPIFYTYDYANRLTQMSGYIGSHTYEYDGNGLRLRSDGRNYAWDQAADVPVVFDYDNSNSIYLYGLGLIRRTGPAGDQYYHEDGLGSIGILTDLGGNEMSSRTYDAFGALRTGLPSNDFFFAGERLDADTGLYYLRARYYDPTLGRFITKDPWRGRIDRPQSLNRYVYVVNQPTSLVDPSGMFPPFDDEPFPSLEDAGKWLVSGLGSIYRAGHPKRAAAWDAHSAWRASNPGATADECARKEGELFWSNREVIQEDVEIALAAAGTGRAGTRFGPNQGALIDLVKEIEQSSKRITTEQARILLQWAQEYGVRASDHIGTMHWRGGSHIRIGPFRHLPVQEP